MLLGVTYQETVIFIVTAMRAPNLTQRTDCQQAARGPRAADKSIYISPKYVYIKAIVSLKITVKRIEKKVMKTVSAIFQ
jgi:hypothetical protein